MEAAAQISSRKFPQLKENMKPVPGRVTRWSDDEHIRLDRWATVPKITYSSTGSLPNRVQRFRVVLNEMILEFSEQQRSTTSMESTDKSYSDLPELRERSQLRLQPFIQS